ncbi:PIN domain-containing protein [Thermosulfurimonas dismutans]|uniref:PIN domain-containing protein n=1 Tax=Thermosulfurimonas dismutans TaxID=999894 RepID=UPI0008385771
MIRAVFDTNVYLSAILFGGVCAELRDLARKGKIEVFVCEVILAEVAGVLRKKFGISGRTDFEPQRIPGAIEPGTIGWPLPLPPRFNPRNIRVAVPQKSIYLEYPLHLFGTPRGTFGAPHGLMISSFFSRKLC